MFLILNEVEFVMMFLGFGVIVKKGWEMGGFGVLMVEVIFVGILKFGE